MPSVRQFASDSGSSSNSRTVTLENTPLDGSLLVVGVSYKADGSGGPPTIADINFEKVVQGGSNFVPPVMFIKKAGSSEPASITVNTPTANNMSVGVIELLGNWPSDLQGNIIVSVGSQQTTQTITAGSVTPAGHSLAISIISAERGAGGSYSINQSFGIILQETSGPNQAADRTLALATKQLLNNDTVNPTWDRSSSTGIGQAATVIFMEEEGGSPVQQLSVPTNFTFNAHESLRQLDGSWSAVSGATSYEYQVDAETSPDNWVAFASGFTSVTSFQLDNTDGVNWSTKYRSRVRAHPPE